MSDRVLLVMCRADGRYIAGAINFIGDECLFGRNWGCLEHRPFLHFEVCYYQAIEFAIEHGLKRVEAGAQESTNWRGGICRARPIVRITLLTQDLKQLWIALGEERAHIAEEIDYLEQFSPFKAQP